MVATSWETSVPYRKVTAMTIEFFCPNEHQLSAPDNMAGKPGKCPKCGSKFLIPTLEELQEEVEPEPSAPIIVTSPEKRPAAGGSRGDGGKPKADAGATGGSKSTTQSAATSGSKKSSAWQGAPADPAPSDSGSSSKKQSVAEAASAADASNSAARRAAQLSPGHFMFLCPNNHKLNGPLSLKGKPGQCPHCGAKFRIPDDVEEDVERAEPSAEELAPAGHKSSPRLVAADDDVEQGILVEGDAESEEIPAVEPISIWQLPPPPPGQGHRLAELFAWVWAQRDQNALVELTLKDDEIFVPKWFAAELSVESYGAFATEDEFGRYSLKVIPWDSVQRLTIRQLEELPPQFE